MSEASHRYVIALGSNMRVPGLGGPREVIDAAITELAGQGLLVLAVAPIIDSAPVGPSIRRYANCAAVIATELSPSKLLEVLQTVERNFGRIRQGQPWRSRTLDLDIVLWDGGVWASDTLAIPHRRFRQRDFVLDPAASIAPDWRDPITGLSLRQLFARLTQPRPIPR
jgi:2-amino-4-hydroxy-6-hydroxymethyldihydropteridine diphosphokinase